VSATDEITVKFGRHSDAATEKRILLLGLSEILKKGPCGHIPGWVARNFEEWDEERRKLVVWTILNAVFTTDTEAEKLLAASEAAFYEWHELIFWAKDQLEEKSVKWINGSLRHYKVKKLWASSEKQTSETAT
tara:strand:- start:1924 stop:2322 length:399 start_codon:yes stop_codon:yes gene_type:complete